MAKYSYTKAELVTKLQNWAEEEETTFTTELDTIVNLACIKVARDLKLEKFRKRATGTFTLAVATITMPADMILLDDLLVNDGTVNHVVQERAGSVLELYAGSGLPKYRSEQDVDTVRVAPTPDSAYTYTAYGMQRPDELVEDTDTNWLTEHVPDLVFLSCLEWTELFLKDDPRADVWRKRYDADLLATRDEFGVVSRNTDDVAPGSDASTGRRTEQQ